MIPLEKNNVLLAIHTNSCQFVSGVSKYFWRVLLLHDTVLRLLTVLFVSHQHNKRTKGCSTVIMLESCHFTVIIRATYDYYPYEVKLSAYYSYLFQHLSSGIFLIFGRHYGEKC